MTEKDYYSLLLTKMVNTVNYLNSALTKLDSLYDNLDNYLKVNNVAFKKKELDSICTNIRNQLNRLNNTIIPNIKNKINSLSEDVG